MSVAALLHEISDGGHLADAQAFQLADTADLATLMQAAARRRDQVFGDAISYSRKVFIPLTHLCRDVCHYCTFAQPPRGLAQPYLDPDQVLAIARAGEAAGCKEALFTLGDRPEARYRVARERLSEFGHSTTLEYLAEVAQRVLRETSLLPHLNPGVMSAAELARLRQVSVSQGIMLESAAERLCQKGGPHHGSPDKQPAVRLATLERAGELSIAFTSGILIGIGETRHERIEALLALRALHERYGHLQEIIIQNFRPKPDTRMAQVPAADLNEHAWTIAVARLLFAPEMNIQAPPNLSAGALDTLVAAGINDWGGVSPVTPDYVNPEAPWPELEQLESETEQAGKVLVERLALYPRYALDAARWVDAGLHARLLDRMDTLGWARPDAWSPGQHTALPQRELTWIEQAPHVQARASLAHTLTRAQAGQSLRESEIASLFGARGRDFAAICAAADELRRTVNGDAVSYVITRNINYTNLCYFKCHFCAFSKGKANRHLRGPGYDLTLEEIAERVTTAWQRGATEVCMQGGIHPDYTGQRYIEICKTARKAAPEIHVHAFSPLEVYQGARTLGIPVTEFLQELKANGLGTLPGTAAEILDDEVRAVLCPDKIGTQTWLEVMRSAHRCGLRSTATIMFGHLERVEHWARHLLRVRTLQSETGGFTEFVPLPFVHMEAPVYLRGRARRGPTFREVILMHAIARLVLHPLIPNIQASWVKLGRDGVAACLTAGVNDLGGTLMDESISRAAGSSHGQEMQPAQMQALIRSTGRRPWQRTTLYRPALWREPIASVG